MKYSPVLHSLRGFAAVWVVLLHVWFFSGAEKFFFAPFYSLGWIGVHLFYALSAFLLGNIYLYQSHENKWSLQTFYKKRFLRIFPAYYFQLIILLILAWYGFYAFPDVNKLIAHLFLFFNLPPAFQTPINGVWWTLPIEFAFYLIMPLLIFLLRKTGVVIFLGLSFTITVSYRYAIYGHALAQDIRVSSSIIG